MDSGVLWLSNVRIFSGAHIIVPCTSVLTKIPTQYQAVPLTLTVLYFYHVEANCNGMLCPPYDPQKELTCAVCTK